MKGRRAGGQLTAAGIAGRLKPGDYDDGDGLYFRVINTNSGVAKGWVFRFEMHGDACEVGLGPYPAIRLGLARQRAFECRQLVAEGADPTEHIATDWRGSGPFPDIVFPDIESWQKAREAGFPVTEAMKPPDIDRIVAAVVDVPKDLDKNELLADLENAVSVHRHGAGLRHQPARRRQELVKVYKAADYLKLKLGGDVRFRALRRELERVRALTENYSSVLPGAQPSPDAPEEKQRAGPPDSMTIRPLDLMGYKQGQSAFDNLVGHWLAHIYKIHFKEEPSITRNPVDDSYTGPFIDFVEAVLAEFHIEHSGGPYNRAAIYSAFRRGRKAVG